MKAKYPSIPWRQFLLAGTLVLGACSSDFTEVDGDDTIPIEAGQSLSFAGNLDQQKSWTTHAFEVTGEADISVTLQWSDASADLNLFLYQPGGALVAHANRTAQRPEQVSFTDAAPGIWKIGIKAKSGASAYTALVDVSLHDAPSFAGHLDSNGKSWTTHEFHVSAPAEINGRLEWSSGNADLNLFLSDPAGTTVEYSATSSQPETVTYAATKTGTYSWGIKNKTGGGVNYQLFMTLDESEPPAAPSTFPGQPPSEKLFWGAAIAGNGDSSRHESPTGETLGVHRTFFQWAQRLGWMQDTVRDDIEKGRLPWVSVKTPSWQAMADGDHDAAIDEMLLALDGFDSPIWLTMHHEPEGGGGVNSPDDPAGPAGHVAMNRHVRQRMTALGTRNIALAPILMTYTWKKSSGRNPSEWWAPGIYDFLGVDHYQNSEASLLDATWGEVRDWAADRDVEIAVGEWGMRGTDAAAGQRVHSWFNAAINSHADGKGARVIGLCAFDSSLNSPNGSWELVGEQLSAFHALMEDARAVLVSEL